MTKIAAVREATNWTKNVLDEFLHSTALNIIASRDKKKSVAIEDEDDDEMNSKDALNRIDESGNPFVNDLEKQMIRDELKQELLKNSIVLFLNYFEETKKRSQKIDLPETESSHELALECVKSVIVMNSFKSINEQLRQTPTGKSLKKISFARASEELEKILSDVKEKSGSGAVISKSDEQVTTKRIGFLDSIVKNNGTSSFTPDEYTKAFDELLQSVLKDSLKLWNVSVSKVELQEGLGEKVKPSIKKSPK